MGISIEMITIDCADPQRLAVFWTATMGTSVDADYGDFVVLKPVETGKPFLGLQKVAEQGSGKNRVHVDFMTTDRKAEVARIVELGATAVAEHEMPGLAWTTLADPEGNVFDVAEQVPA
jgi:predicted enzyme related to lactoylglutathione lyase